LFESVDEERRRSTSPAEHLLERALHGRSTWAPSVKRQLIDIDARRLHAAELRHGRRS